MTGEVSFYGMYIPWLLIMCLLAIACSRTIAWLMTRFGLYRLVWHPALFDFALFVIVLGALVFFLPHELY